MLPERAYRGIIADRKEKGSLKNMVKNEDRIEKF